MLDHHPLIACNPESEYMVSQIGEGPGWPEIAAFREWLARERSFRRSQFTIDPTLDYVGLMNDLLLQKLRRGAKSIVGATVHYDFDRLPRIWPAARYVYLLRDGRDVARSVVGMGWEGNLWAAADRWIEAESDWETMRAALDSNQWIEIRYESLLLDPEQELARVCGFLGVEYSDRMLEYVGDSTYARPDPTLANRWKQRLSQTELRVIETRIADHLTRRGYPLSGQLLLSVTPWLDRRMRLESRIRKYVRRIRMLGVALTIEDTLARRLGVKAWQRACQRRVDDVIDKNLK